VPPAGPLSNSRTLAAGGALEFFVEEQCHWCKRLFYVCRPRWRGQGCRKRGSTSRTGSASAHAASSTPWGCWPGAPASGGVPSLKVAPSSCRWRPRWAVRGERDARAGVGHPPAAPRGTLARGHHRHDTCGARRRGEARARTWHGPAAAAPRNRASWTRASTSSRQRSSSTRRYGPRAWTPW
jgi:hypothetical protein